METLVALCYHAAVAAKLKAWSAYAVVREMERFEKVALITPHTVLHFTTLPHHTLHYTMSL